MFMAAMGTENTIFQHYSGWKSSELQEKFRFFDFESFHKKLEQYIYIYMNISEFLFELVAIILVYLYIRIHSHETEGDGPEETPERIGSSSYC